MIVIRYHWNYPSSSDPFYLYNTSENMARNNYYGNSYSPHLFVDGNIDAGSSTNTWGTRINSELAVSSPLDIQIDGNFNPTNRTGTANIRIIATGAITNTNLKVRIAITESDIHRSSPNNTQIHDQVFRDMVPSTSGIALTIAEGDTVNLSQAFSCPSPLVLANTDIIVFVQSDTGHRILQAAMRDVLSMVYNLSPFTLISPENHDTLDYCTVTYHWHPSADVDSGYAIRYLAYVNMTNDFSSPFLVSDTLTDTTWTSPLCLPNDTNYYWKVTALNGHANNIDCDQVFTFRIHEPPTGCIYSIGDVNNNGAFNGIDVSYAVGYFKGGNVPPYICECTAGNSWYVAGDVNGNCQFNGIDVSYSVGYFKGGPSPVPCPSCPPISR